MWKSIIWKADISQGSRCKQNWDGLEGEFEITGYTVNEPSVWEGILKEERSRKAEYWQGGDRAWTESQG